MYAHMASSQKQPPDPGPPHLDAERTEQFVQLLAQHRQELYRFIFTLHPHKADADDLLQQTSVVLWRKFEQFTPGTDFVRWASSVAQFEVRDFRKSKARDRHRFWSDEIIENLADVRLEELEVLAERREAMKYCVEQLPPEDRRVLEGRYAPKGTIKALAEKLGRPANTLYKSLDRIRRALTECVDRVLASQERS